MNDNKLRSIIVFLVVILTVLTPITYSRYSTNINKKIKLSIIMPRYTIHFDANGGTGDMDDMIVDCYEEATLTSNTFVKPSASFIGWNIEPDGSGTSYSDGDTISKSSCSDGDEITLYAQWIEDDFPTVYSHTGGCTFNGTNGLITGDECSEYHDVSLINTGIALFSEENYDKDFEISFNIDDYDVNKQEFNINKQPTLLNAKLENAAAKYPGYLFRNFENSKTVFEFTGVNPTGYNKFTKSDITITDVHKFAFRRLDGKIYYSINDSGFIYTGHDTNKDDAVRFDTPLTIGGSLEATLNTITGEYTYTPFRIIVGTLSNITVKLGDIDTSDMKTVTFNGNGGTTLTANYNVGERLGGVVTTRDGYIFDGWYTKASGGELVPSDTIITDNITYYAHWVKSAKSLTFQDETITLNVGDTFQLVPTNSSEIAEEWTYNSGRAKTVTVDQNGLITAKGIGQSYIRVRGKTSDQYKDIIVVVSGSVYDMTFTDYPINIILENNYDAYANISNISDINETFTFTSSNTSIFTVDSTTGVITPKKVGTAKLRIVGSDSAVTVEVPVNIGNVGSVAEVKVLDYPINIVLGNTYDAKLSLANLENITESYTYSASATSIFTVDSATGVITPKKVADNGILRIKGATSGITIEVKVIITNN